VIVRVGRGVVGVEVCGCGRRFASVSDWLDHHYEEASR